MSELSSSGLEAGNGSKTDGSNRENIGHVQLDSSGRLGGRGASASSGAGRGLGASAAGRGNIATGSTAAEDSVQLGNTSAGLTDLGRVADGGGGGGEEAGTGSTGTLGLKSGGGPVADAGSGGGVLDESRELQDVGDAAGEAGKEGGMCGFVDSSAGTVLLEGAEDARGAGVKLELSVDGGNEGDGGKGKSLELHFEYVFVFWWLGGEEEVLLGVEKEK